jgi:isocitrate dehydrogenase kinase/phosphatase
MLFSFARAYFMVDMEVPSAYVQFLRSLMPRKPRAEIYNALGLAKQGKTLFYRDFLYHLKHSSDRFRIAPGIKGMVMLVFDLPSFPYVFKVIKDHYPPQKDTTREQIKGKYLLVKQHDRVGRMADTLEYSEVAFARDRFEDELIEEIRQFAPSQLEISDRDGDGHEEVIIKHLYIERRMIPLNIYLQEAFDAAAPGEGAAASRAGADRACRRRVRQRHQGPGGRQHLPRRHAVEELRRHPQRQGRVLRLRRDRVPHRLQLPQGAAGAQRGRRAVRRGLVLGRPARRVPGETFGPFLLGNPAVREPSCATTPTCWTPASGHQERIQAGHVHDVFPYDARKRFIRRPGEA